MRFRDDAASARKFQTNLLKSLVPWRWWRHVPQNVAVFIPDLSRSREILVVWLRMNSLRSILFRRSFWCWEDEMYGITVTDRWKGVLSVNFYQGKCEDKIRCEEKIRFANFYQRKCDDKIRCEEKIRFAYLAYRVRYCSVGLEERVIAIWAGFRCN